MQRDVDMILASALLHDVGQYPFSHSIEDLRKLGNLWNVSDLTAIQHDQEMAAEVLHRKDQKGTSIADLIAEMCG